jgi:hypothetical protein
MDNNIIQAEIIDIYNKPEKTITILCHTTLGDTNDPLGRFYLKGNEYKMNTEVTSVSNDTNNQECILCWIDQTKWSPIKKYHVALVQDLPSKVIYIMMVNQSGHTSQNTLSALYK